MRTIRLIVFGAVIACLAAGCATPGKRLRADWPGEYGKSFHGAVWHQLRPALLASTEEAIGAIKNLQNHFCALQGYTDRQLDVDRYGLRLLTRSVETSTRTDYVPTHGGAFVGRRYVPIYGGSYQSRTMQTPVIENVVVPFDKVRALELFHLTGLNREFKWLLDVHLEDAPRVQFRAASEVAARELANAIATLVEARHPLAWPRLGLQLVDLSNDHRQRENLSTGVLVRGVAIGGPAARAGLRYPDVLVRIREVEVTSAEHVRQLIAEVEPGTPVGLTLLRWESVPDAEGKFAGQWREHRIEVVAE